LVPNSTHDLVFFQNQIYLYWPPFPALVLMPFVLVFGVGVSDVLITTLIGALNVAGVSLLLKAAAQRGIIHLSETQQAWLTIFFAFGTVHMTLAPHGNIWFTSQLIGMGMVLLTYLAALKLTGWKAYLAAGACIAAAMSTRYPLILAGIWPAWYLLNNTRKDQPGRLVRNILIGLLPLLLAGGLIGWYNYSRFGNPFDYGYAYHNMGQLFRADYEQYGPFNLHYLPINFYYQYLYYPFPISEKTLMGGSLFLLSPLFFGGLWALWQDRRNVSTWILLVSISAVNIPILLLMGTGWMQFGPRYTLDFSIPLLLLTAIGIRKLSITSIGLLTFISILQYLVGAILLQNL
jgi:hypothetical protein